MTLRKEISVRMMSTSWRNSRLCHTEDALGVAISGKALGPPLRQSNHVRSGRNAPRPSRHWKCIRGRVPDISRPAEGVLGGKDPRHLSGRMLPLAPRCTELPLSSG